MPETLRVVPLKIIASQNSNACSVEGQDGADCCAPEALDTDYNPELIAELCKAIAHPARVKLLKYLEDYGQCYFGKLTDILDLAPSTISQHVTILKNAGLIESSADEQRMCYCVVPAKMTQLKALISAL